MSSLAANSRVRLNADELRQLCWLLGLGLALLAFWTVFSLKIGSVTSLWLVVGAGVIAFNLVFPGLPGLLPSGFWRWVVPVSVVFIVLDFVLSRGDVVPPLVRMVTLLILFRCLQYRRRREDMQLVLMCLFTTVLSGVLTASPLFAFQILVFAMLALALLLVLVLLESGAARPLNRQDWQHFLWWRFLARLFRALDLRLILLSGLLFTAMVGVSTVIFVLMPRFSFDQAFSALQLQGQSGFSDTISFSKTSNTYDDSIAFHVDPPPGVEFTAAAPPYWRMIVMDKYDQAKDDSSLNAFRCSIPLRPTESDRAVRFAPEIFSHYSGGGPPSSPWRIYMEGNVSEYLPILGPFNAITFNTPQAVRGNISLQIYRMPEPSAKPWGFKVEMMDNADAIPENDAGSIRALTEDPTRVAAIQALPKPMYPQTLLGLPQRPEDLEYLRQEARKILNNQTNLSAAEFSQRAIDYLRTNHRPGMSVNVLPLPNGADPLVHWMKSDSPGWCEYFAGAFVFLARAAGYPARIAAGFKGATYNTSLNYYVVRNDRAHAWAEIFNKQDLWLRVDPTPGALNPVAGMVSADAPGKSDPLPAEAGLRAHLDGLRMLWYRRVINFDQADQQQLADRFTDYSRKVLEYFQKAYFNFREHAAQFFTHPLSKGNLILLGALAGLIAVVASGRRLVLNFWLRWSGRGWLARLNRQNPVRHRAGRWLARFHPVWRRRGPMLAREERAAWDEARAGLLALRYGPVETMPDPVRTFRQARLLLRQARRQPLL